ncbi:phosphoserine phosphatase SerB [Streptococcus zalophi]|uniref:phosphoserine phosphatase n=1 Tax=Streptococcus zalophi TaxID=640031 RepID=A0A934P9R9_9STRE|nr:phosphoserine phosphatase SerB [Streptococcus zalophi]MBJ8349647.1 phosphoserine phosphatase SerB [Streptococcus zalophi]MCR8968004.1 phosphoserine phosphatase SerB [Streptococcus zalophi]
MAVVKGLLVMDVDSTLIQEEVIDQLGEAIGKGEEIASITDQAMRGELDFRQSLEERVTLLKGLPDSIFNDVLKNLHYTKGAEKLVSELHNRGYKVGLVSGGFHEIVDKLAEKLSIDYVKANRLEVENGILTGRVTGDIVTKDVKKEKLEEWASENQLDMSKTVAVGDGANDLLMLKRAGLGIAFCAKPIVREQADYQINEPDLYQVISLIDTYL